MASAKEMPSSFEDFCRKTLRLSTKNEAVREASELMDRLERLRCKDDAFNSSIDDPQRISVAWYCCAIFLTRAVHKHVPEKSSNYCLHLPKLSDLVKAAQVSLIDISLELRHICRVGSKELLAHFGESRVSHIEQFLNENPLETGLVLSTVLLKKYMDLYLHYFKRQAPTQHKHETSTGTVFDAVATLTDSDKYFELGLVVFLVAKESLLPTHTDLISLYGCLVVSITFLIREAPEDLLQKPLSDLSQFPVRMESTVSHGSSSSYETAEKIDLLGCLASYTRTNRTDLAVLYEKLDLLLQKLLSKEKCQPVKILTGEMPVGFLHDSESGLVSTPKLNRFLFLLKNEYERLGLVGKVEVDEQEFCRLNWSTFLGNPSKLGSASMKKLFLPRQSSINQGASSLERTPIASRNRLTSTVRSPMPFQTPITTAMASSQWLRKLEIDELPCKSDRSGQDIPQLGASLAALCRQHDCEQVLGTVHGLLSEHLHKVFRTSKASGDPDVPVVPEKYYRQAAILFYRALSAMVESEISRQGASNRSAGATINRLLCSRSFLSSLAALASECVVAAYRVTHLTFPGIERRLGVIPFDVEKLIDQLVHHEPSIPQDIKRHLHEIEERICEQYAWEKGSSFFHLLKLAHHHAVNTKERENHEGVHTKKETHVLSQSLVASAEEEGSARSSKDISHNKEMAESSSAWLPHAIGSIFNISLLSGQDSTNRLSGPGIACVEFLKKAVKLSAERTEDLCNRLQLPVQTTLCACTVVESVFLEHSVLLYGRHIDQIMLCSLYGTCKARRHNIQFKEILIHYRRQHQSRPEVYRNVAVELTLPGLDVIKKGDIIDFYNATYVPLMKKILLQLASEDMTKEGVPRRQGMGHAPDSEAAVPCSPTHAPSALSGGPKSPKLYTPSKKGLHAQVHVSPIPRHKQERLMAESTEKKKSLFAFFGETTHAFQSPAKDLNFINGCINNSVVGSSYSNALKRLANENSSRGDATVGAEFSPAKRVHGLDTPQNPALTKELTNCRVAVDDQTPTKKAKLSNA